MATIIIGGDICPVASDRSAFERGDATSIFGDLLPELEEADFCLANLETPLIEAPSPIAKSGAVFGTSPKALKTLKNAGFDFLNLANNHILDHGQAGLQSTINALEENDISYTGAGQNLAEATRVFVTKVDDIEVGILSYCEYEFSIATPTKGGANPVDLIQFTADIAKLRDKVDFILLLYHGGRENYALPTPKQRKTCRFFVEQGVDMVVCQHSHIAGVYEELPNKGVIFYGQGNFVFDPVPLNRDWLYTGYLVRLNIHAKRNFSYDLIPFEHSSRKNPDSFGIKKMPSNEAATFLKDISSLSEQMIQTPGFLEAKWKAHCLNHELLYFSILHGHNKYLRKINEYIPFLRYYYAGKRKLTLRNIMNCETHHEIVQTILNTDK